MLAELKSSGTVTFHAQTPTRMRKQKKTDDEYAYQHMLIISMQFLEGDENLLWGSHAYASQLN